MSKGTCSGWLSLILLLLLCACGQTGQRLLVSTPTRLPVWPTATRRPTYTKASTWTPLPQFITPEFTFVLTEADTSTPAWTPAAAPLSEAGPWLAVNNSMSFWVGNPDGTGFVQLGDIFTKGQGMPLVSTIAPHGGRIALFYPPMQPSYMFDAPPDINVIHLPSLSQHTLPRFNTKIKPVVTTPGPDPFGNIYAALTWGSSMAWSPDGTSLAFASAQDGPSVDLYTYSTVNGSVSRLTSGPAQTTSISWSPDGHYIVSAGATDMGFGRGGGNGAIIETQWAVRPDGSDLHAFQTYPGGSEAPPILLGWVNNQAFVEYYGVMGCGNKGLTFVNIESSSHYTLIPGAMGPVALNPKTGTALVLIPKIPEGYDNRPFCGTTPEPGVYLVSVFGSEPPKKLALDASIYPDVFESMLSWSAEANLFFLAAQDGVYTVDLGGKVTLTDIPNYYGANRYPFVFPKSSPDGREWAVYEDRGLWIASPDQPVRKIFDAPVDDVLWTPDGSALLFVSNNRVYRAAVGEYQPVEVAGPIPPEESSRPWQLSWVMP